MFLLFVAATWAQPLRVYSEFAQIDAAGRVTAPPEPREILSPAIARNAFSSFQIVVDVPRGTSYQLYVAQNPENAVEVTLYRENGERLERVEQPVSGNGTQVFWMDLWTARDAPVQRIKVEPQLHVNNDWVIYPMEARVMNAITGGNGKPVPGTMPPIELMHHFLCSSGPVVESGPLQTSVTIPNLRLRNAMQDRTLASDVPKSALIELYGSCDAPIPTDPEWYLRIRDYLLRLR
ncbi:MAG: hypothetical protein JWO19_1543 [Bryobacterales bacterium]|nr:hypothetical protein [Bryobacterales bacterium]